QGPHRQGRSERSRRRGQRDRGVRVHGAVRRKCHRHCCRRQSDAVREESAMAFTLADRVSRSSRSLKSKARAWNQLGEQTVFYGNAVRYTVDAMRSYKKETLRLVAQMSLGTGALAVIGGTVVIVGFLTLSAGALIAVQGYNSLSNIGVEALTGFLAAFLNVRIIAPLTAGIGLAATIGAGATAQLGAMRISEEIDALEVMGIRSISYL